MRRQRADQLSLLDDNALSTSTVAADGEAAYCEWAMREGEQRRKRSTWQPGEATYTPPRDGNEGRTPDMRCIACHGALHTIAKCPFRESA